MANKSIKGLTVKIGGDTTELGKALDGVEKKSRDLSGELKDINKLLKLDPGNVELLAQKQKVLTESVGNTEEKLKKLREAEKDVQQQFKKGKVSEAQVRALQREIVATEQKLGSYDDALKDTNEQLKKSGKAANDAADGIEEMGKESEKTDSKLGGFVKGGIGALVGAVAAVGTALIASAEESREYRREMGKLDTAFTTAGHSSEAAKETYQTLQGVLGETDQAVEASNHLAKLAKNEKDLEKWTDICTGVYATFGASIPIEGLTEAANETAKTGALTGSLADALNWAGVSEEQFQAQLDKCNTEQERQALITETLNGLYSESAEKYRETNEEVIRANEANEAWASSMADIGGAIEPILTDVKTLGASLLADLVPGVQTVADALRGMLNGDEGAAENMATGLSSILTQLVEKLGAMLPGVVQTVSALISTLLPQVISVVAGLIPSLVTTLAEQLPVILEALISGFSQIMTSIGAMLPDLIPLLVDAVIMLAETLIDNVDLLVDSAIVLIMGLADGLLIALPRLIDKAPIIIEKLVTTLANNAPKLLQMGCDLLLKLAGGLIQAIPQLLSKIPQIVKSILSGFKNYYKDMTEVGKDFIKGLWNGISDMAGWIGKKIKGFGEDVLGGIKSFFGIKSPSRVFRDQVGKMLAEGLAIGIEDNADAPLDAMASLSSNLLNEAGGLNGLTLERQLNHTFTAEPPQAETSFLGKLDSILAAIERGQVLTIDGGALVGATAQMMDNALGQRRGLAARGVI